MSASGGRAHIVQRRQWREHMTTYMNLRTHRNVSYPQSYPHFCCALVDTYGMTTGNRAIQALDNLLFAISSSPTIIVPSGETPFAELNSISGTLMTKSASSAFSERVPSVGVQRKAPAL